LSSLDFEKRSSSMVVFGTLTNADMVSVCLKPIAITGLSSDVEIRFAIAYRCESCAH
jgi:hypothetical protein